MSDNLKDEALEFHRHPTKGKLAILPTKPLSNQRDLALAYSPGVAYPCEEIAADPSKAAEYTARGNLVAVISNGTAVLGLGAIGALASKPVMEGKAVLFKKFADIDVFDIEVDETDVDKMVDVVAALEPTFGGINLEDIKAPECFFIEQKLRERMNIPVFHDDQHGTAIVSAAAIYNGLKIVDKKIEDVKLVVSGSGAASIACTELLIDMGLQRSNVLMIDRSGVIYKGREQGMNPWKESFANATEARTLADAMEGADIFLGLSAGGIVSAEMVKKMAPSPLILAMANPTPEILPEIAKEARPDAIIATGRSDYPNQVNNVLCFPFMFRGALDCGATSINEEMKKACVKAIADMAHKEPSDTVAKAYAGESLEFGPEYLIPKPFDPRLIEEVPIAVVKAAMESGVATRPIEDMDAYAAKLKAYNHRSRIFMKSVIEAAKAKPARIVYAEGENSDVLRAIQLVVDEGISHPLLIGNNAVIERKIKNMKLRLKEGRDYDVLDPENNPDYDEFWQFYHKLAGRNGVSIDAAKRVVRSYLTVIAAICVALGKADGLICGKIGRFDKHFRSLKGVLGNDADHVSQPSTVCALLHSDGPLFMTDPFINLNPTAEELVGITENAIDYMGKFGIKPKVAILSHSNFGSYEDPEAKKMKKLTALLKEKHPDLEIDGEMNSFSALNPQVLESMHGHSTLNERANLLIMPNVDTANISLGLIRSLTNARLVGPYMYGLKKPAHVLIPSVSMRGIFNITALTVADIAYSTAE